MLNPFAARLLTSQHNESLAVHAFRYGFYALVLTVSAAALLAMLYHMVTRAQAPGISSSATTASTWQTSGMMLGFGLSIPVFFATTYGWALWFAVPMATQQVYHFRHKERRKAGAT